MRHRVVRPIVTAGALLTASCAGLGESGARKTDTGSASVAQTDTSVADGTVPTSAGPPTTAATTTSSASTTSSTTTSTTLPAVEVSSPAGVIEGEDAAALATSTSRAIFSSAPIVVVAGEDDVASGATAATTLGVPLLLSAADAWVEEVDRLGAEWVLAVGDLAPSARRQVGPDVTVVDDIDELPATAPPTPPTATVALVPRDAPITEAAAATVSAAGIPMVPVDDGDPRAATDSRERLAELAPSSVVAIGPPGLFPDQPTLDGLVATAVGGRELPGGGQVLFPDRRLVAIYGHPGDSNLGVLGEQSVEPAVDRARAVAGEYTAVSPQTVIPTFEIITTIASSEAGPDGDYSLESSLDHIRPWVDAAAEHGMYVVLDLQPGFTDFLTQAKRYEEFLVQPHVGLALDPEWRLAPGERHLVDIGQVGAAEVNQVADWLAGLTRQHALPQKLLLLHQFRIDMLPDREDIRTHPELALVVQMDGLGTQDVKLETWGILTDIGPDGVRFGWKNFYDEDTPTRSAADTVALEPSPVFVSYQ